MQHTSAHQAGSRYCNNENISIIQIAHLTAPGEGEQNISFVAMRNGDIHVERASPSSIKSFLSFTSPSRPPQIKMIKNVQQIKISLPRNPVATLLRLPFERCPETKFTQEIIKES
jgi:hypothetical protein